MGNYQCGNGEGDVLSSFTHIHKCEEHVIYVINHGDGKNDEDPYKVWNQKFNHDSIIGMTPEQACEYVKTNTPKWNNSDGKICYICVKKRDGERKEVSKIGNRRGISVKIVKGRITYVYNDYERPKMSSEKSRSST